MKAIAKVVDVKGVTATVVSKRSSACESCHNCENGGVCHAQLVFGNQVEEVVLDVKNTLNAKIGDIVELESSTNRTLFVSIIIFILPIIVSVISYFVADKVTDIEYISALSMIVCFVTMFAIVTKIMNLYTKKHLTAYIVKILEESDS